MDMYKYEELKEMLCKELEEIVEKGKVSAGDLEAVGKLLDGIKDIGEIEMLEDGEYSEADGYSDEDGYGERGSYAGGSYARGGRGGGNRGGGRGSYAMGGSYARRKRDNMGRYSRAEGKEMMMTQLEDMMQEASEKEREILKRAMRQLETA